MTGEEGVTVLNGAFAALANVPNGAFAALANGSLWFECRMERFKPKEREFLLALLAVPK